MLKNKSNEPSFAGFLRSYNMKNIATQFNPSDVVITHDLDLLRQSIDELLNVLKNITDNDNDISTTNLLFKYVKDIDSNDQYLVDKISILVDEIDRCIIIYKALHEVSGDLKTISLKKVLNKVAYNLLTLVKTIDNTNLLEKTVGLLGKLLN
jgi:hypothetical protein